MARRLLKTTPHKKKEKERMKPFVRYLLISCLLLFSFTIYAADGVIPEDEETFQGLDLILKLIPLIVPLLIASLKFIIPKIPGWALPIAAPALGALVDYIAALATDNAASPVLAALLGSAGVGIRELLDQIKQKAGMTTAKAGRVAVFFFCLCLFGTGMTCRPLDPGADPLVVRVEQASTLGKQTVQTLFNIDHADRGFWKTNAPAFHNFVNGLRQPQVIEGTNTLPRGYAILWSLQDVKNDYKLNRASSNQLWTALQTVQSVLNEAGPWLSIVTNQPTRNLNQ